MSDFKLPWPVKSRSDLDIEVDFLPVKLGPDTSIDSVGVNTDIYGDGTGCIGIEFCITSREDRSDDEIINDWETKVIGVIRSLNPEFFENLTEWDREGGETEWYSKHIFAPNAML